MTQKVTQGKDLSPLRGLLYWLPSGLWDFLVKLFPVFYQHTLHFRAGLCGGREEEPSLWLGSQPDRPEGWVKVAHRVSGEEVISENEAREAAFCSDDKIDKPAEEWVIRDLQGRLSL